MMDVVKCEYPLPLPDDLGECQDINWEEFEFKTVNFDGVMDEYEITDSGELYWWKIDREWEKDDDHLAGGDFKEIHRELEKLDWTGELLLAGVHLAEKYDYIFEFKIIFFKGEIRETEKITWKKQDTEERKLLQKKVEDFFIEKRKERETPWYTPYNIWSKFFLFITSKIKWILRKVISLIYWIERALT